MNQQNPLAGTRMVSTVTDTGKLKMWLGVIIGIFAFLLYARSITFQYTLDDTSVVHKNKLTSQGIKAIPQILKTDYWYGFNDELRVPQYRPSSLVMFAIETEFFPGNTYVNHLVNVVFYALTCLLVFLVLCKLFKNGNLIFPFICTLLYAAHPIHTEVVNSIKSLDEIFCFFFGILSIYLLLISIERKSSLLLVPAAVSYLISLGSKETAVSFLFIIPLTLFTFKMCTSKQLWKYSALYVGVTIVFFIIWFSVVNAIEVKPDSFHSQLNNTMYGAPDFISEKATVFYILLRYVFLLILPVNQSYDYSFAEIPYQQLSDPGALAGLLLYLAVGIYAIIKIKDRDYKAYAILFYLLTLAPVSNMFLLIGSTMAERFMYMPSLGFVMLLAFFIQKLVSENKKLKVVKNSPVTVSGFLISNKQLLIPVLIITGLYSVRTIVRSEVWKDNVTLFGTDVKTASGSARTHSNWGYALLLDLYPIEQDAAKKEVILDKAMAELNKGLSIFPGQRDSYQHLAYIYELKKNYPEQIKMLETIIENYHFPDTAVFNKLAIAYSLTGQYDKALAMVDSSAKYKPSEPKLDYLKGFCYLKKGMFKEAIPWFEKYAKEVPDDPTAITNLGVAYLNTNQRAQAVQQFEQAMKTSPDFAPAYCYMGRSLFEEKKYRESIDYFNKSLALDSLNEECMAFTSQAYIAMGDVQKAYSLFEKAKKYKQQ